MAQQNYTLSKYTVIIVERASKTEHNITSLITDLSLEEDKNGIAQKATITIKQHEFEKAWMTSITNVCDRVFIYASDGEKGDEVFRGYIWTDKYEKDNGEKTITLTCYDNLIYLQESEESRFFKKGKKTADIFKELCSAKGITLNYSYKSITHEQIAVRGKLSDVFLDDLIEEVRKETGYRGVVRYEKGTMYVFTEGSANKDGVVCKLTKGEGGNIIKSAHEDTMDGVITQVTIITTQTNAADKVNATVSGNTSTYGTINKLLTKSSKEELSKLKKEASQYITDYGHPQRTIGFLCVNIPWIRKGDKVYYEDGYKKGYAIVTYVKHKADEKTMELEVREL